MTWRAFAQAAPELAAFGETEFGRAGMALVATVRGDGSPRVSCVEPCIMAGELYLGMMWRSRKALDLLRDPRILLHNAVCTNTGNEAEFSLRGRVSEVRDPWVRRRFIEAVAERSVWTEPYFHLFKVEIVSAALVEYGGGEQSVKLWPHGRQFTRSYG